MKNTFRILSILLISVILFGCKAKEEKIVSTKTSPVTSNSTSKAEKPEIAKDDNQSNDEIAKLLIGSWHADSHVASGFHERYVFYSDSTFVFFSDENNEAKDYYQMNGNWSISGRELHLTFNKKFKAEDNTGEITKEKKTIILGEPEKEDPDNSPYETKMKFGEDYFWKYSDDIDIWQDEIEN